MGKAANLFQAQTSALCGLGEGANPEEFHFLLSSKESCQNALGQREFGVSLLTFQTLRVQREFGASLRCLCSPLKPSGLSSGLEMGTRSAPSRRKGRVRLLQAPAGSALGSLLCEPRVLCAGKGSAAARACCRSWDPQPWLGEPPLAL